MGKSKKKKSLFDKFKKSVVGGVSKVTKTGRVGIAAGRLYTKVANPINLTKTVVNAARGKGVVLPGTKYIGPGNRLDAGKPTSSADAAARRHDYAYDDYLAAGVKPSKLYMGFSDADQRLIKQSDVTTPDGLATYSGMKLKQAAYKLGLTGKKIRDVPGAMRKVDDWTPANSKNNTGARYVSMMEAAYDKAAAARAADKKKKGG